MCKDSQVNVGGEDVRVPPLNDGHLPVPKHLLGGKEGQLGGGLDPSLLGCLGDLCLQLLQLGLDRRQRWFWLFHFHFAVKCYTLQIVDPLCVLINCCETLSK